MAKKENFTADRIAGFKCQHGKSQSIYWDGKMPGLGLRVTSTGTKSFVFETRLHGKTFRCTIGSPDVWPLETQWRVDKSTGEKVEHQRGARQEAARLKALTDQGIDPRDIERAKNDAREAAVKAREAGKLHTLARFFEAYCSFLDKAGKGRAASAARSAFKVHVDASLKDAPAKSVQPEAIADMLRAVTEKGKARTAGVLRSYLLAAYGIGLRASLDPKLPIEFKAYGIEANPVAAIPAIASKSGNRVLTNAELKKYLAALGTSGYDAALRLALYAGGQRMEQLTRATVYDWTPDGCILRLFDPKGRRAQARLHYLPLGPLAAEIVAALAESASKEDRKELFPFSFQMPGKRLKAICQELEIAEPFDLRDIRRTVETRMAALGISKDIRAQLLSHGLSGVQEKHYDRHSYETEKRNALMAWENWLESLQDEKSMQSNIVQIDRKTVA